MTAVRVRASWRCGGAGGGVLASVLSVFLLSLLLCLAFGRSRGGAIRIAAGSLRFLMTRLFSSVRKN